MGVVGSDLCAANPKGGANPSRSFNYFKVVSCICLASYWTLKNGTDKTLMKISHKLVGLPILWVGVADKEGPRNFSSPLPFPSHEGP